jgi:nitrogen PTS system EIIA component
MITEQLIKPDNVVWNVHARSKKHSLEILGEVLARENTSMAAEEIFARLIERERLGSTGLQDGVAFPHCRFEGVETSHGAVLKLAEPVEFDSPDGLPVDLIVGLMVPIDITEGHRADIAGIKELLNDASFRQRLRTAATRDELYAALLAGGGGSVFREAGDRHSSRGM